MNKIHDIQQLDFDGDTMLLVVDGQRHAFRLSDISEKLAKSTDSQRRFFRFSPSGYGIHWPELDEDLSVDGLIKPKSVYKASTEAAVLRENKTNFKSS